jgi:hypothetical protein
MASFSALLANEEKRWRTMTVAQMTTRLGKITSLTKLQLFKEMAEDYDQDELAKEASKKLRFFEYHGLGSI